MITRSSQRHVHQPPFFLSLFIVVEAARGRKPAIDRPDDEDRVPLLPLRRVGGAEDETVVVLLGAAGQILGCLWRLEGQRREEGGAVGIAGSDDLQLIEIREPRLPPARSAA